MESHVLNSYHTARYQILGHGRMGSTRESCSSESSSCNQNSPDYKYTDQSTYVNVNGDRDSNDEDDWDGSIPNMEHVTQTVEITSNRSESGVEDNALVYDDEVYEAHDLQNFVNDSQIEVNKCDYEIEIDSGQPSAQNESPIIYVFAVDPESDLEYSSSEEDWHIQESQNNEVGANSIEINTENDIQLVTPATQHEIIEINTENGIQLVTPATQNEIIEINTENDMQLVTPATLNEITDQGKEQQKDDKLDLSFEMPAVINVDDFFIKETKDVKLNNLSPDEETVVSNVDEYCIQPDKNIENCNKDLLLINNISELSTTENCDNKKTSTAIETPTDATIENYGSPQSVEQKPLCTNEGAASFESTPEVLSANARIDRIKRFLMDDFSGVKSNSKTIQKSCSLPHSPAHMSYLDIDDGRTSFSFEDLNINDLSDLSFEEDIIIRNPLTTVTNLDNKDDSPRTLTEEDVNQFLITNKTKTDVDSNQHRDSKDIDDLSQIDFNSKAPIISVIDYSSITTGIPLDKSKGQSKDSKKSILKNITTNLTTINPNSLDDVKCTIPIKCESTKNLNKHTVSMKIEPSKFEKKNNISMKIEHNNTDAKVDEDYVDVESYNDTSSIPVLEANNLSSLLEQFEATEKLNNSESKITRKSNFKVSDSSQKIKVSSGLINGTRLQDAAMQLNKNKIRQILISTAPPKCTVSKKSNITVHSDHDYCSPKKRRSTIANIKKGQSLLKPEVLSSNNRILKSRHRTCKNKKVVYHLSSEDEIDSGVNNNKSSVNPNAKTPLQSNHRKKLSPVYSGQSSSAKYDNENSVIPHTDFKVSDNSSQVSSGSIKLTIKNKSKVILNLDCDLKKDSLKQISNNEISKRKSGSSNKIVAKNKNNYKSNKTAVSICDNNLKNINSDTKLIVNEETRPVKQESKDFYVNLFDNKQDLKVNFDTTVSKNDTTKKDISAPEHVPQQIPIENKKPTKKKLNLQEYKLRKEGVCSASNSRTVSPEAIFPDIPIIHVPKNVQTRKQDFTMVTSSVEFKATVPGPFTIKSESTDNAVSNIAQKAELVPPRKLFDPIRDASRKILMLTKKHKAEAMRKRDEDIVMSKIPKIENYVPQSLAEILNITEPIQEVVLPKPTTIVSPKILDLEEIIMVSVGVNTEPEIFKYLEPKNIDSKLQAKDCNKSIINFKIKKSDTIIKQNVFETFNPDKKTSQIECTIKKRLSQNNCKELKIDKERYKNITQVLKHVERNVEAKISSNSLFASIQDVVKKSKLDEVNNKTEETAKIDNSTKIDSNSNKNLPLKVTIVRDYDNSIEHGEDKVILHLDKDRLKPTVNSVVIQTDQLKVKIDSKEQNQNMTSCLNEHKSEASKIKRRRESDMSLASECSPTRELNNDKVQNIEIAKNQNEKVTQVVTHQVKVERSRRDSRRKSSERRYIDKSYRHRSHSRSRTSKTSRKHSNRSRSRYRSRSPDMYRRYRRSDSPYRRKRSPYRSTSRREFKRSRCSSYKGRHTTESRSTSRSKFSHRMSRSPITKAKSSPSHVELKPEIYRKIEKEGSLSKADNSMTPPLRKPSISECSESSTSSSSSSSSGSSTSSSSSASSSDRSSVKRRYSLSPDNTKKKCNLGKNKKLSDRAYSSDGRDTGALVEERRIVFVGKLEKETTKSVLRSKFSQFGPIMEVTIHTKEDGTRYGFVTFARPRDAWSAVEAAATAFPSYDVGFGGRRAFCRQSYADLDGLEAEYSECYPSDPGSIAAHREVMSFEQMLLDVKKKLSQMKQEKKIEEGESEP